MSTAWVSSRMCRPHVRYALGLALAVALFATDPGLARAAGAPAGLPGPPPEAGTGIPLPPPPGQDPPPQPFGSAATLPLNPSGPGLLSGSAGLTGSRLKLQM